MFSGYINRYIITIISFDTYIYALFLTKYFTDRRNERALRYPNSITHPPFLRTKTCSLGPPTPLAAGLTAGRQIILRCQTRRRYIRSLPALGPPTPRAGGFAARQLFFDQPIDRPTVVEYNYIYI